MQTVPRLTFSDFQSLETLLQEGKAMPFVSLHGFLTALLSSRMRIYPADWIPVIWEEPLDIPLEQLNRTLSLIMGLHNHIVRHLANAPPFYPLLSPTQKGY